MTTSTLENKDIQEAIRELEEQWKRENEERMNDYKEKLNVLEDYLNEQYPINKEIKSLYKTVLLCEQKQDTILTKHQSYCEKQYTGVQKYLTYLRDVDKKTSSSSVREMFEDHCKSFGNLENEFQKFMEEEIKVVEEINITKTNISEWIDLYNEIGNQIKDVIGGDSYLNELCNKLPIFFKNKKEYECINDMRENIKILEDEMNKRTKKVNKTKNKIQLDMNKIAKRMCNLGFGDIYEEVLLQHRPKSYGKKSSLTVRRVDP